MSRTIRIGALSILTLLAAFTATAFASAAAVPEDGSSLDLLRQIYEAFTAGHHLHAGMIALVAAVALFKRYGGKLGIWAQGDIGGSVTTLVGAFATAMVASTVGGVDVTLDTFKGALKIAVGAAGGYALIKKLVIEPILKPLAAKAPAWLQPVFAAVFWIFDKKTPTADAEAAGKAAVEAKPAQGVKVVSSKVTEID